MKNLKINRKGKTAELQLNGSLYPEGVVKKVAGDFKKILDIGIKRGDEKITVTLKLRADDLNFEEVVYNFINYLLAEVKGHKPIE